MKTDTICCEYQAKVGCEYVTKWATEDEAMIYDDLAHELIAKKINACLWIRSIKRMPLHNGYDRIIVTYDHGGRRIYTVTCKS